MRNSPDLIDFLWHVAQGVLQVFLPEVSYVTLMLYNINNMIDLKSKCGGGLQGTESAMSHKTIILINEKEINSN